MHDLALITVLADHMLERTKGQSVLVMHETVEWFDLEVHYDDVRRALLARETRGRKPKVLHPLHKGKGNSHVASRRFGLNARVKGKRYRKLAQTARKTRGVDVDVSAQEYAQHGLTVVTVGYERRDADPRHRDGLPTYDAGGSRSAWRVERRWLQKAQSKPALRELVEHYKILLRVMLENGGMLHRGRPLGTRTPHDRLQSRLAVIQRRRRNLKRLPVDIVDAFSSALLFAVDHVRDRGVDQIAEHDDVVVSRAQLQEKEVRFWWKLARRGEVRAGHDRDGRAVLFVLNNRVFNALLRPEAQEVRDLLLPRLAWRPAPRPAA